MTTIKNNEVDNYNNNKNENKKSLWKEKDYTN